MTSNVGKRYMELSDERSTGGIIMMQYKVLIIEDDLNVAQSISQFLSAWGFQCEYLKNFQQIMEQFIQFKPEIILSLPGLWTPVLPHRL